MYIYIYTLNICSCYCVFFHIATNHRDFFLQAPRDAGGRRQRQCLAGHEAGPLGQVSGGEPWLNGHRNDVFVLRVFPLKIVFFYGVCHDFPMKNGVVVYGV